MSASEDFKRAIKGKERYRDYLVKLPFEAKIALVEKMRERSYLIARSPLRRTLKNEGHAPPEQPTPSSKEGGER